MHLQCNMHMGQMPQIAIKIIIKDITGIGRRHQICGKLETTPRRNVKLMPKYFERQDDFIDVMTFLTLYQTF